MPNARALLLVAASVTLAGCINSSTLIKVKPDGSGTVEQTTLMNTAAMKPMVQGMAPPGTSPGASEAELRRAAERMGKGVRLVSTEPARSGAFEGTRAIFAFEDINQVAISQDPGTAAGASSAPFGGAAPAPPENPVKFTLQRTGATSTLTVQFQDKPVPAGAAPGAPQGGPDMMDPAMLNMVKSMFDGFKVNIALEVGGAIVKTNAEYVDGSRVTLLDVDLAQLFQDQQALRSLQGKVTPGASLTEVKPYLRNVKGIRIDGPVVNVEFR